MDAGPILTLIIGALIGFVSTYLAAVVKLRKELEQEYDKNLRAKRIEMYAPLWQLTSLFPKYGTRQPVTIANVQSLSDNLRHWYFDQGGMFLTPESRDRYFALQEALKPVVQSQDPPANELPLEQFEAFRKKGSELRTALVIDVGTRKDPTIGGA